MCLALYKPAGVEVNWDALETGMKYNSDGAGFAVAVDGQLIIEKGFFRWDDFRKAFEPFSEHASVVHFRLATHGDKNKANCHPFSLADFGGDNLPVAVIHNGIFFDAPSDQKQWSDTWHVCRDVLHPLWQMHPKIFGTDAMVTMGDKFVGSANKLVFLAADGTATIWGEANGHWKDGAWYSNHSYECSSYADPRYRGKRSATTGYLGYSSYTDDEDYWHGDGRKSAKESAKTFTDKELEDFAKGTFDDDEPILDLSLIAGDREQAAISELRECGCTDVEIEEIFLEDGIDGLIEELADTYSLDSTQIEHWLDSLVLHGGADENRPYPTDSFTKEEDEFDGQEVAVAFNPETEAYEPV